MFADFVGRRNFCGFLAPHRSELFRDKDFASLSCPNTLVWACHSPLIIDLVEQCPLVYRGGGAKLVAELVPEVAVDLDEVFSAAPLA
jgi:hypothetical protein